MPTVHRTSITYCDRAPLDSIDGGYLIRSSQRPMPTSQHRKWLKLCSKTSLLSQHFWRCLFARLLTLSDQSQAGRPNVKAKRSMRNSLMCNGGATGITLSTCAPASMHSEVRSGQECTPSPSTL